MKPTILSVLFLLSAAAAGNGCAHFAKTSTTTHELVKYGAAVPPDWRVVTPVGGLNLPGGETNAYTEFAFTGETNTGTGWLANGPRIFLAYRETWTDRIFTDPQHEGHFPSLLDEFPGLPNYGFFRSSGFQVCLLTTLPSRTSTSSARYPSG